MNANKENVMFGFGSAAHHKWKKRNRVKQWIVGAFYKHEQKKLTLMYSEIKQLLFSK